jgi:phage tail-like protein
MPGIGFSPVGEGYVGSVVGPVTGRSLGVFNFQAQALSIGSKVKISITIPGLTEAVNWARELRVLRKIGEWPDSHTDSGADLVVSKTYPTTGGITETFEDSGLLPGQIYYYALFEKQTDGVWINDTVDGRASAYPYDRWGCSEYIFSSMPPGWQTVDTQKDGDLEDFLKIFGALMDNLKTDCENLLTLFDIDAIHADLLPYLDRKIAWPTWYSTGTLQQRKETALAVDLYKLIGRKLAYETALEEVSGWDASTIEGWRYVMFTNNLYNSVTPDTTDPNILPNIGRLTDTVKYTNDNMSWHSVTGLVFQLSEIPGVSEDFSLKMAERYYELIDFLKATFVTYSLYLIPISAESFAMTRVVDTWNSGMDTYILSELYAAALETNVSSLTTALTLFETNNTGTTTTTVADRVFHSALSF